MKNKSVVGWFLPLCEKGKKVRALSLSAPLLKMMDYKIDDLALDVQHLGAQAFEYFYWFT